MYFAFALLVLVASASASVRNGCHPLIVLSFDGISPEEAKTLTNLKLFKAATVKAVTSVFPTKTFSTHFSVATGEKPAVHGVIGNTQYNQGDIKVRDHPDQWRYVKKILPIWSHNEEEGGNSGTMMWPGAQFKYGGEIIDESEVYKNNYKDDGDDVDEEKACSPNDDGNYSGGRRADFNVDFNVDKETGMKWNDRIKKIVKWVKEGDSTTTVDGPANLVMAYFEDYGSLKAKERGEQKGIHIKNVDAIIGFFKDTLDDNDLFDKVDVIIMSDHGTHISNSEHIIKIDEILEIQKEDINILASGPLAYISPEDGENELALKQLRESPEFKDGKFKVYEKSELKWNMNQSGSVLPQIITVVAEPPYTFFTGNQLRKITQRYTIKEDDIEQDLNGYDNAHESMDGFFYGTGPSFLDNKEIDGRFDLDEVYPLIKLLIGLDLTKSVGVQKNNSVDNVVKQLLEKNVLDRIPS